MLKFIIQVVILKIDIIDIPGNIMLLNHIEQKHIKIRLLLCIKDHCYIIAMLNEQNKKVLEHMTHFYFLFFLISYIHYITFLILTHSVAMDGLRAPLLKTS